MKLDIRYVTRFGYDGPVVESQNELRACPASDERQALLHYQVTTTPSSRVASYTDFWGTRVDTFGVRTPHPSLEVVAEATVETAPQPLLTASPRQGLLTDPGFRDQYLEFLEPSPHVDWGAGVAEEAMRRAELAGDDVVGAVLGVHRAVGELEYVTGETYVGVSVDEVLAERRGVCQDFAHLAVAMYRSLGVPSRYVSGYFFTVDDASGAVGHEEEVEVETHAWVEVAIPTGRGDVGEVRWMALDPTNQQTVGDRHVTIGRGRDYDDVAPFRGVFSGSSTHDLEVNVTMRRLAVEPLEAPAGATLPRQRAAAQQQQ